MTSDCNRGKDMAYEFYGCIGNKEICKKITSKYNNLKIVNLYKHLFIVPMPPEYLRSLKNYETEVLSKYEYLTNKMINDFIELSLNSSFAYLEAEYFGGTGNKACVIFENTKIISEYFTEDAFNIILRYFGINKNNSYDEFDEVGFGKNRFTVDW